MRFGVEYEMERARYVVPPAIWHRTTDGTLRDEGVEFVTIGSLGRDATEKAIVGLLEACNEEGAIVSPRCSTHIHCDMTKLRGLQRMTFFLGMVAREAELWAVSPQREGNPYCVSSLYNPALWDSIARVIRAPDWSAEHMEPKSSAPAARRRYPAPANSYTKYTGINVMTLGTIGTVELRHFSPLVNIEDVCTVLDICEETYAVSKGVGVTDISAPFEVYGDRTDDATQWTLQMYRTFIEQANNN